MRATFFRLLSEYGMVLVLFLLCVYYSLVTVVYQFPSGTEAATSLTREVTRQAGAGARVLVVAGEGETESDFAKSLADALTGAGADVVGTVRGQPLHARSALEQIAERHGKLDASAASQASR